MTQFFLVRHGPTHLKSMIGWTDAPADLSDVAALSRLSAHLPQDAVVVSSDLIRAVTTADAVQGTRPRLPHDPDLRELNFGRWEQRLYTEAEAEDDAMPTPVPMPTLTPRHTTPRHTTPLPGVPYEDYGDAIRKL